MHKSVAVSDDDICCIRGSNDVKNRMMINYADLVESAVRISAIVISRSSC